MELLILKSAACLAILKIFYKLFLEHLSIHKFKRIYLLGALVVSIVIPFITFIEYIEPVYNFGTFDLNSGNTPPYFPADIITTEPEPTSYLPIIIWSIYGLGVLLFASKFCINLFGIISKINKNEKQKHSNFISVLLNDIIVPHTFFSYIFLNKTKFEAKAIPEEVILHEQTHASQKHSLDVLFIELLQIVFWFNPLLYFIKKDIKLNHEFLADEAVLKQGIDSSTYQETLLQFTSTANEIPLAHAINYSLIKKRFTIMKTKTSKKAIWLRSLLLLPLLGGLLFSFSGREQVEKEVVPAMVIPSYTQNNHALTDKNEELSKTDDLKINHSARSIDIKVIKDGIYKINDVKANKNTFLEVINQFHMDISKETRNNIINVHVDSPKNISNKEVRFIYNSMLDYGFHRIVAYNQEIIKSKGNTPLSIENESSQKHSVNTLVHSIKPTLTVNGIVCDGCQLNLSKGGVEKLILGTTSGDNILEFKIKIPRKPTEVIKGNTLNTKAITYLNKSEIGTNVTLFDIITEKREKLSNVVIKLVNKNAKNYSHSPKVVKGEKSNIPPPPPPAPLAKNINDRETGYININGETYFYSTTNGITKYYNRFGNEVDKKGNKLSNKQTEGDKVVKGQKITKVYKDGKIISEFKKTWTDEDNSLPPPPPPAPPKVMKGIKSNIPPPPPPMSTSDHVIHMAKKDASFYYDGKPISSDKALDIVKNNSEINLNSRTNNGKSIVKLSKEPFTVENGKVKAKENRKKVSKERKKATEQRKKDREIVLEIKQEAIKQKREAHKEEAKIIRRRHEAEREEVLKQRKEEIEKRKKIIKERKSTKKEI